MAGQPRIVLSAPDETQYLTLHLGDAQLCIALTCVQKIIPCPPLTPIPLTPAVIAGAIHFQGRIATVLHLRHYFDLGDYPDPNALRLAVIEQQGELYALMVDAVGDIRTLAAHACEALPQTTNARWRGAASGVYTGEETLLVLLDPAQIIEQLAKGKAA